MGLQKEIADSSILGRPPTYPTDFTSYYFVGNGALGMEWRLKCT